MKEKLMEKLEILGYNTEGIEEIWEDTTGNIFFRVGEEDDITGYICEVDPERNASRHCGNGEGCFWTEWEE